VAAAPMGTAVAGADEDRDQAELRFHELYRANFRPVQGYAVNRLGAADDVPDVVAEVFTIAWRRLADVPPPPADRFWLYGTARRVIARRYRSAGRLRNLLGRLAAERYPTQQPPAGVIDPVQEQVLAALAKLRHADREALLLVHWEQLSYAEAAPARHMPLDDPDSPTAVRLYQQITAQPPAAALPSRRRRFAVPALIGVAAAAMAAALALDLTGSPAAPRQGGVTLAAWSVVKEPHGLLKVTIRELRDPSLSMEINLVQATPHAPAPISPLADTPHGQLDPQSPQAPMP